MPGSIASINVQIGATTDKLVKGLKSAERELKRSGAKFERLGSKLASNVTLPLVGIGLAGGKMAADLSDNFSKIENLVGVTADAIGDLQEGVKKVSGEVGKSQAELSSALFTITSAGIEAGDALEVLEVAAKASVIGMGDTATIAKAATSIMAAYGSENVSAAQAVNLLTKTVKAGNLAADELAPTIGKLLPIAQSLGIEFEELGANIAVMSRLGLSGSESITALKAALGNIQKGGPAAEKSLKEVDLSIQQLRDSIRKDGLAATFDLLIEKYKGNTDGLAKLFGSVEGLSNVLGTAGAQGEEYSKILAQMKDGTDVVATGFENASKKGPEIFRQSMVKLQNVLIDIGNIVIPFAAAFVEKIAGIAKAFSNLSGGVQKFIVTMGGLLAALGPVISLMGKYKKLQAFLISQQAAHALAQKAYNAALLEGAAATRVFSLATKATIIGVFVAAVAGAIAIFEIYNDRVTTAQKVTKQLGEINATAGKAIVEQKMKVEKLVESLNKQNTSYEDKKRVLEELQKISPEYFGGLSTELSAYENIKAAQDKYLENLFKIAKAKAQEEALTALEKKLIDVSVAMDVAKDSAREVYDEIAGQQIHHEDQAVITTLHAQTKAIEENIEALKERLALPPQKAWAEPTAAFGSLTGGTPTPSGGGTPTPPGGGGGGGGGGNMYEKLNTALLELNTTSMAADEWLTKIPESLDHAAYSMNELEIAAIKTDGWMTRVPENMETVVESIDPAIIKFNEMEAALDAVGLSHEAIQQAATAAGEAMGKLALSGQVSMKSLAKASLKASGQIIRGFMAEAVAAWIKDSYQKLGIAGTIVASVGAGVVLGLFDAALGSIKTPQLAAGGLAYGPSLAMVGEGSGTSSVNPEVIAPLDKLKGMLGDVAGAKDVNVRGHVMLKGSDLLVLFENASNAQLRKG